MLLLMGWQDTVLELDWVDLKSWLKECGIKMDILAVSVSFICCSLLAGHSAGAGLGRLEGLVEGVRCQGGTGARDQGIPRQQQAR